MPFTRPSLFKQCGILINPYIVDMGIITRHRNQSAALIHRSGVERCENIVNS